MPPAALTEATPAAAPFSTPRTALAVLLKRRAALAVLVLAALGLAACAAPSALRKPATQAQATPRLILKQVSFAALTGWLADDQGPALRAFKKSCPRDDASFARACAAAGRTADGGQAPRLFFETWFTPYLATANGVREGLFTGYFEARLRGSMTPGGRYGVPIYGPPEDLVSVDLGDFSDELKGRRIAGRVRDKTLKPYDSRAEITAGSLAGRGLELLWVDDPVDAFFLHIQGSGRVLMNDGRTIRLGFAGRNGHPYRSIGRELATRGEIAKDLVSMPTIRAWIKSHPAEGRALMAANPSYIFFRIVGGDGGDGPIGAQGVALTPGRSLAVDRKFIPLGTPLWLDTSNPLAPASPLRRLVIAQDSGAAIRGPVRGDLFWGWGEAAAAKAGAMKSRGRYYLLRPNK